MKKLSGKLCGFKLWVN